jgi:hypothetical protein
MFDAVIKEQSGFARLNPIGQNHHSACQKKAINRRSDRQING